MIDLNGYEIWFVTGSQELYGEEVLQQVAADSVAIIDGLNASNKLPVTIVFKPVVTSAEAIFRLEALTLGCTGFRLISCSI